MKKLFQMHTSGSPYSHKSGIKKRLCLIMAALSLLAFTSCRSGTSGETQDTGDTNDIVSGAAEAPAIGPEKGSTAPDTKGSGSDSPTTYDDTATEEIAEDADAAPRMTDGIPDTKKGSIDAAVGAADVDPEAPATTTTPDTEVSGRDSVTEPSIPEAGQLTAGEWNDNDNWGFFTNLCTANKITFPSYGLDPRTRTAVTVQSADNTPVTNAVVRLTDQDGQILWTAMTDHHGKAYLFTSQTPANIVVESNGQTQSYVYSDQITFPIDESADSSSQQQTKKTTLTGEATLTFNGNGNQYPNTDIMFIVDTTGSMSDEMLFLQSEFSAIAQAVGNSNTLFSVNFYRDKEDDYITKNNDFTADVGKLQTLLNSETADGGGDLPEAVGQALDESINRSSWRANSVKLAFLIFDAPPHDEDEAKVAAAVKAAAAKGIRLIPVVSSNSDRNTELFGRALAIETGGTYVFLTNDSGIGGDHLDPIIGEYKVEKLYDIIIRIINSYQNT